MVNMNQVLVWVNKLVEVLPDFQRFSFCGVLLLGVLVTLVSFVSNGREGGVDQASWIAVIPEVPDVPGGLVSDSQSN